MDEGGLAEEIEILEAIYIEELEVQKNEKNEVDKITLQLHPATGEDLDKRYVCMTLILDLSTQYPDVPPDITIKNPRGIAEEEILSLREDMHKLCEDRIGGPVLYELIELAKDSLTAGNIPHCPCMICLEHFHEGEKFTKTECYHYFHESCLSRYVTHVLTQTPEIVPAHATPTPAANKLVCPVCREEIHYKFDDLDISPIEDKFVFVPSPELLEMQERMASMFEEQKAKGGIIDIEAERNKYLLKHGEIVLMSPLKRENKQKSDLDKQKSLQSLNEVDHQKIKKDIKTEEVKNDNQRTRSDGNFRGERNDKFRYAKDKGNRSNDGDSPRDSDKRWEGKRITERRFENNASVKTENGANFSSDYIGVKDSRNKPYYESRGKRYRNKDNDKRLPNDRKETFVKGSNCDPNCSEKPRDKTEERTSNAQKGFGRPKRKDECDNNEKDEGNQSLENENVVKEVIETNADNHIKDVEGGDRKFQGNRGGFGRPPSRGNNREEGENYRRNNQSQRRGGFGRPPSRGDSNEYDEKYRRNNQSQRRGGFGKPHREGSKNENLYEENTKQNRDGFGRPDRHSKEKLEETSGSFSGKESIMSCHKSDEKTRNLKKGFGQPKRKDDGNNKKKDEEKSLENENIVGEISETNAENHIKDDKDKVVSKRENERTFQGGRGSFGRPPSREDNNDDGEKYRRNNKSQRKGGFGRPQSRGGTSQESETYTRSNQSQRRGGYGKSYKSKDESQLEEKTTQSRGGFGRPDSYSKENLEETSRPFSGKGNIMQNSDRSSQKNLDDQPEDGTRQNTSRRDRGRYNDNDRESWKNREMNSKSDENFKYSDEDRSYTYSNDRRSQAKDKSRYYDRGGRGSGRGRGNNNYYQPRNQYENESNKSKSYSSNKSPRDSQRVEIDTESVDLKLDKMVLSDNQFDHSDNCRQESFSKESDKNDFCYESTKHLSSSKGEKRDSKSDCLTGPPGFVTKRPPGFEQTEENCKSVVKPPPGFNSQL